MKEPRKAVREAVREAWAPSSHDIHHVGQVLRCEKCMTRFARSKPQGGLDMPCRSQLVGQAPEFKGVLVHWYTRPMIAEGATLHVKCGGWTTKKAKKLASPCKPATASSRQVLNNLADRKLPPGLKHWRDG